MNTPATLAFVPQHHDVTAHANATRLDPDGSAASGYRSILQHKIDEGARRAAELLTTIERDAPRDQILRMTAARFHLAPSGGLRVAVGSDLYEPTDFAVSQIAARVDIPLPYLRELTASAATDWQRDLAITILGEHHRHNDGRVLVRSVSGQLRGWLSDRYRRLDSRPLIEALAEEATRAGAVPIDAVGTDTRVALKIVLPEILEPIPGEFLVYGGEWGNSDFGNGVHSFRMFALRVVCLNGMTAENVLKQVHLGGRLSDAIEFSERTHRLDTATSASALRDVVRAALSERRRDAFMDTIRAAHERSMSKAQLSQATRTLSKPVQKSIVDAFDSADVINLPPGHTAWRGSNAISWVARHTENAETRLDLERAAGALV
jgi:hypothetical protein